MPRTDKRYNDYMHSDTWRRKAEQRRLIDDCKCTMCGCTGTKYNPLQIHHLTYKHLGNEDVYTDLVTVCEQCHVAIHRLMNRKTNREGRRGWKDGEYTDTFTSVLQVNDDEYQIY